MNVISHYYHPIISDDSLIFPLFFPLYPILVPVYPMIISQYVHPIIYIYTPSGRKLPIEIVDLPIRNGDFL